MAAVTHGECACHSQVRAPEPAGHPWEAEEGQSDEDDYRSYPRRQWPCLETKTKKLRMSFEPLAVRELNKTPSD